MKIPVSGYAPLKERRGHQRDADTQDEHAVGTAWARQDAEGREALTAAGRAPVCCYAPSASGQRKMKGCPAIGVVRSPEPPAVALND
jgi:hypothetical protein